MITLLRFVFSADEIRRAYGASGGRELRGMIAVNGAGRVLGFVISVGVMLCLCWGF